MHWKRFTELQTDLSGIKQQKFIKVNSFPKNFLISLFFINFPLSTATIRIIDIINIYIRKVNFSLNTPYTRDLLAKSARNTQLYMDLDKVSLIQNWKTFCK